ncbi:hypothetical protein GQ600_12839 [Phytophthora cactorum]|nr:hypothetical protein GQ600_12839 [Phytophthora cactorum]
MRWFCTSVRIWNCSVNKTADALTQAFKYAVDHSDAGKLWKVLFNSENNDETNDDIIVEKLTSVTLDSNTRDAVAKKLRKSKPDGKAPVLVVAIDEA